MSSSASPLRDGMSLIAPSSEENEIVEKLGTRTPSSEEEIAESNAGDKSIRSD